MRILVIEDDYDTALALQSGMSHAFVVDISFSGKRGLYKIYTQPYDCIILDHSLPDTTGIEICTELRTSKIFTPILFVTANNTLQTKVKALDAGADDYISKPYAIDEVLARVRALLRRSVSDYSNDIFYVNDLMVNLQTRTITLEDKTIHIRKKAFDLLAYLLKNKNSVISRSKILEHVWENCYDDTSNTVDVHVKHIRDTIDKKYGIETIKTVYGVGYTIEYDGEK